MNKIIKISLIALLSFSLLTGCGNKKEENNNEKNNDNQNQTVVDDQVYEGLEFVNTGVSNGIVKTIVINNTGYVYEGSKFSMKVMDENGNVLVELTDEVKDKMETGTTKTIETKTNVDLTNAASIEYSIVK